MENIAVMVILKLWKKKIQILTAKKGVERDSWITLYTFIYKYKRGNTFHSPCWNINQKYFLTIVLCFKIFKNNIFKFK